MKIASITEAKNSLSALIDGLKAGSPVLVVDRGRLSRGSNPWPAMRKTTPTAGCRACSARVLYRPRRSDPSRALFVSQPPRVRAGASGVDALIQERREGR